MIRLLFAFILLVHSLIHILGFTREFQLKRINQLKGESLIPLSAISAKATGVLWLFTCILFFITLTIFLVKKDEWWIYGAVAVLLSQTLIILYWHDAKFGTIANLVILVAVIISYGSWNFNRMVKTELKTILQDTSQEKKIISPETITGLPPIVQKWLHRSNILGKEMIHTVHLHQKGEMRTEKDGKWMPVSAEQYFTVNKPGFIWIADVEAAPYIHLSGRDKYENGNGYMVIKLLSLIPVADAKGKETDQGTLLRYLAEIVWFPSAALENYISWEEIDSTTAKATMSYKGTTASGIFKFTPSGDMVSFETLRYYSRKEGATLEKWFIAINKNSYKEFAGIRIPASSTVTWKLKTGDFTWYKLEVTNVEYNEPKIVNEFKIQISEN